MNMEMVMVLSFIKQNGGDVIKETLYRKRDE